MYNDYRSFICYRLKSKDNERLAASEDVAAIIGWWINQNKNLAIYPAMFEQQYSGTDVSYRDFQELMRPLKKVFIVMCPDFFKSIIDIYRSYQAKGENAAKRTIEEIESKSDRNIYYYEIKSALEILGPNKIEPISVRYEGCRIFNDQGSDKDIIIEIFGEKMRGVVDRLNVSEICYDSIKPYTKDKVWSEIEGDEMDDLMEQIEGISEVAKFKGKFLNRQRIDTYRLSKDYMHNRIISDLKLCTQTICSHQKPNTAPRSKSHFYASNPAIIYDPIRVRYDKQTLPPFLAQCMIDDFKQHQASFKLPSDVFGYWDVGFDTKSKFEGLSVCAVCFGSLVIQHRLKIDNKYILANDNDEDEDDFDEDFENLTFAERMNRGINLLIALRHPYTKTWPSLWVFDGKTDEVEGTVNQTTLSLSTLLSCDFLSFIDHERTPLSVLINRSEFIWESINSLITDDNKLMLWTGRQCYGWGYKINREQEDKICIAYTVFVLDTIVKLMETYGELRKLFIENGKTKYSETLGEYINWLNRIAGMIINLFEESIANDGSFGRIFEINSESTEKSITHTAYVVKSLHTYLSHLKEDDRKVPKIKALLNKASDYLLRRMKKMYQNNVFSVNKNERYEMDEGSSDQYEHCVEMILAVTLMKVIDVKPERKNEIWEYINWILIGYMDPGTERVVRNNGDILIKGTNKNLEYPIFALYYYRMMLLNYLAMAEKFEEEDESGRN